MTPGTTESIIEWTRNWAAVRQLTDIRPTLAATIAVRVGRGGRTVEHFVTTPGLDPDWLRTALLAEGAQPHTDWITIPLTDDQAEQPPPGFDWARADIEHLMSLEPTTSTEPAPVDGYTFTTEHLGTGAVRATYKSTKDGQEAGSATMLLRDTTGVIDSVAVHEDHRRKGLAAHLMRHLHNHAAQQKTTRLLLVASPMGKHLYDKLGWHTITRLLIATVV
ncbi:hypothetical protein GCM10022247_50500 [Allokutzneria multivorans]|uniref:N-acetyltransferase domain-containing protein n=1 Tax=Allokutzneria multivorans TaxID=1142134 RepID=A0ABP7T365_9PSEU